ncbi:MAG: PhnD/SsuA/transferrin family substrate-binding protein [Elusimicrobiota bacterium]|nr:PhnD/SsuA/transferrin family substrate-binding protein [Elusimicrobiota bacterium]
MMKKIFFAGIVSGFFLFSGCGNEKEQGLKVNLSAREVDGACAASYMVENSPVKDKVKVIAVSPLFPRQPVVAGKKMKAELRKAVKSVLLSMHRDETGKKALKRMSVSRFISTEDSDYDFPREIAEAVK